jgi:hypothetical protein
MNMHSEELVVDVEAQEDTTEEQLTVEVPVEIRAGAAGTYPCCKRAAL